jgi:hypothetical protein
LDDWLYTTCFSSTLFSILHSPSGVYAATLRFLLHKRLSRPSETALGRSGYLQKEWMFMRAAKLNPIFGIFVAAAASFFITTPVRAQSMSCAEVPQIATDTFILGCPLTATGMALLQTGNVAKAGDPRAPLNPLVNLTRYGAPSVGD